MTNVAKIRRAGVAGLLLLATTAVAITAAPAGAAVRTWSGLGASDNWSIGGAGGNWTNAAAPIAADAVTFAGTTRLTPINDLPDATQINAIVFNATAGSFLVSGNAINLAGNITNSSVNLQTLSLPIALTATRTISMTTGGGDLIINSVISETASTLGITLGGTGTLTLNNANLYSGLSTIGANRILAIGHDNALGTGLLKLSGGTIQASGSARQIANTFNDANGQNKIAGTLPLTFTGRFTHVGDSGTVLSVNNTALTTFSGGIDLRDTGTAARTLPLSGSGNILINSVITNGTSTAGALTYQGTGTLTLSANNLYTGTTSVTNGTLILAHTPLLPTDSATGSGAVNITTLGTLAGAGRIVTANLPITLSAGGKLSPAGPGAPGTFTFDTGTAQLAIFGGVTPVASASLVFDVGTASDSILMPNPTSVLNIGLALLEFDDFAFTPAPGLADGTYTLIDTAAPILGTLGTSLTGQIAGLDATLALSPDGTDLQLLVGPIAPIPEPSSTALLLLTTPLLTRRPRR